MSRVWHLGPRAASTLRLVVAAAALGAALVSPSAFGDSRNILVLVNDTFKCANYPQPVNFDLVKVTIEPGLATKKDAVHLSGLGPECTGRIGRLEVDTWAADGVKVHNSAHDLVIGGGYVRCHAREGDVHQDGIQALGGRRVTFQNLEVSCATANNAAMFINEGDGGQNPPEDVVCDGCLFRETPDHTNQVLTIGNSIRSGARNSIVYGDIKIGSEHTGIGPVDYVLENVTELPASADPYGVPCTDSCIALTDTGEPLPVPDPVPTPEPAPEPSPEPTSESKRADLLVSTSPNRAAPVRLDGASLTGAVYVFAVPPQPVSRIVFYLDGEKIRFERSEPYDFAGGSVTEAKPWDTGTVAGGEHRLRARLLFPDGTSADMTAAFTVQSTTAALKTSATSPTTTVTTTESPNTSTEPASSSLPATTSTDTTVDSQPQDPPAPTPSDTVPPKVTISYDIVGEQPRVVGVDVNVADGVGVARVWLTVDGIEVDAKKLDGVRSATLRLKIPARSLPVGMHMIVVYAVDAAGNRGSAAGDLEIK